MILRIDFLPFLGGLFKRSNLLVRGELGLDLLKSTRFAMEGLLEFVTKIVNKL